MHDDLQSRSTQVEQDLVKVYLNQMSSIPPISPEEERVLAGDLEQCRHELRDKVLESGISIDGAIRLLDRVLSNELPADRVLLMELETKEKRDVVMAGLAENLPRMKRHLLAARRDFRRLRERKLPAEERLKLKKAIQKRSLDWVALIAPFQIQMGRIQPLVSRMHETLIRMRAVRGQVRALERREGDPKRIEQLRKEYQQLEAEALTNPRGLRRHLLKIRALRQKYEESKKRLSNKNLRLVVSIAKKFRNKGLPFLDLIQEGNTGLMKALDRYQASRGNKFSTYATWWIKQTITRSIAYQSRTVRIPIHAINNLNRLIEEREAYLKRTGREPAPAELAKISKLPEKEVQRLLDLNRTSLSLDQPYGSGDEGLFGELLEDARAVPPVEASQHALLKEAIAKLLKTLSFREREVLKLRYGLNDGCIYTLEEVGAMFKVSRERIRQIEVGALQKLQLPLRKQKLRGFWDEINEN